MSVPLEVEEGLRIQGTFQNLAYSVGLGKRAAAPSAPVLAQVLDEETGSDVKATVMPDGVSLAGNTLNTGLLLGSAVTAGRTYRVVFNFTEAGNKDGGYFRVYFPL